MAGLYRAGLMVVAVCLLSVMASSQAQINTTVDTVEVNLGQEMASSLVLYNPENRPDIYDIAVGTVMSDGEVAVQIVGDDRTSDRVTVELGPGEQRSVEVTYSGAACQTEACTGTATFVGRSLETDQRFTADTQVTIRRDTQVYGSPGLEQLQLVVIGIVAAALSIFLS